MVFSSPWFWAFFVCTLLALAPPFSRTMKKRILMVASCIFYAAWDARYLALLLGISVVDYVCAARIQAARVEAARIQAARIQAPRRDGAGSARVYLWVSVVSNLGTLAYFKYTNFFIANLNVLGFHVPAAEILLPAGISFYTFKTMSYVIDVYRGELEPCESWLDYAMFITFFPELIAGPIVRGSVFLPQMGREIGPSRDRLAVGGSLFLLGFSKKIMADHLGTMVTPVFAAPLDFDTPTAWVALLGYTLQIYLDFSGYSDMAVGCAKAIGYDLPENFRMPYLSRDITEFWRRWHITLSTWLRDYLYIPLGGNRHGQGRTYLNLTITMLLGGLWHGASWNFVLWGALHGVGLAVHRALRGRGAPRLPVVLSTALTFSFVALCWIPFRCTSFDQTVAMFEVLSGARAGANRWISVDIVWITAVVALAHWVGTHLEAEPLSRLWARLRFRPVQDAISGEFLRFSFGTLAGTWSLLVWLLLALMFVPTETTPFIYFQF